MMLQELPNLMCYANNIML